MKLFYFSYPSIQNDWNIVNRVVTFFTLETGKLTSLTKRKDIDDIPSLFTVCLDKKQSSILTYSVGRCVILCAFFGKSVKHAFSCKKMYPV